MDRRIPDLSKITALIGYKPTKTVNEVIESVIEYLKKDE